MRRGIIWLMIGAPLTLIAVAGGAAAAVPGFLVWSNCWHQTYDRKGDGPCSGGLI
jgi:hypothetical protein